MPIQAKKKNPFKSIAEQYDEPATTGNTAQASNTGPGNQKAQDIYNKTKQDQQAQSTSINPGVPQKPATSSGGNRTDGNFKFNWGYEEPNPSDTYKPETKAEGDIYSDRKAYEDMMGAYDTTAETEKARAAWAQGEEDVARQGQAMGGYTPQEYINAAENKYQYGQTLGDIQSRKRNWDLGVMDRIKQLDLQQQQIQEQRDTTVSDINDYLKSIGTQYTLYADGTLRDINGNEVDISKWTNPDSRQKEIMDAVNKYRAEYAPDYPNNKETGEDVATDQQLANFDSPEGWTSFADAYTAKYGDKVKALFATGYNANIAKAVKELLRTKGQISSRELAEIVSQNITAMGGMAIEPNAYSDAEIFTLDDFGNTTVQGTPSETPTPPTEPEPYKWPTMS